MTAFRPEAESEYSRGPEGISGSDRRSGGPSGASGRGLRLTLLAAGLIGSLLLLAAEFTPLLKVHTTATRAAVATVQTGSHNSYALIPIGVVTIVLTLLVLRTRNRLALLAGGVLGLVALLIALLGDLPDAQQTGVTHGFVLAKATPSVGLYLETLGAAVLLLSAAAGLLFLPAPDRPRRATRRPDSGSSANPAPRSAS
jgi:hypothetical protein